MSVLVDLNALDSVNPSLTATGAAIQPPLPLRGARSPSWLETSGRLVADEESVHLK